MCLNPPELTWEHLQNQFWAPPHLAEGRRNLPEEATEEGRVGAWQQRERRNVLRTTWFRDAARTSRGPYNTDRLCVENSWGGWDP